MTLIPIALREDLFTTVDTIDDLLALDVPTTYKAVLVKGYSAADDGGGGWFYYDPDSDRATDGGTCFVPDDNLSSEQTYNQANDSYGALPHQNLVWGTIRVVWDEDDKEFSDLWLHGHGFGGKKPRILHKEGRFAPYAQGVWYQIRAGEGDGDFDVYYKYATQSGRWIRVLDRKSYLSPSMFGAPAANGTFADFFHRGNLWCKYKWKTMAGTTLVESGVGYLPASRFSSSVVVSRNTVADFEASVDIVLPDNTDGTWTGGRSLAGFIGFRGSIEPGFIDASSSTPVPANGYFVGITQKDGATGHFSLYKRVNGSSTTLDSITGLNFEAGGTWHVKISAQGSALKAKYWTGGSEPGTWDIEVTDSAHADGYFHAIGSYNAETDELDPNVGFANLIVIDSAEAENARNQIAWMEVARYELGLPGIWWDKDYFFQYALEVYGPECIWDGPGRLAVIPGDLVMRPSRSDWATTDELEVLMDLFSTYYTTVYRNHTLKRWYYNIEMYGFWELNTDCFENPGDYAAAGGMENNLQNSETWTGIAARADLGPVETAIVGGPNAVIHGFGNNCLNVGCRVEGSWTLGDSVRNHLHYCSGGFYADTLNCFGFAWTQNANWVPGDVKYHHMYDLANNPYYGTNLISMGPRALDPQANYGFTVHKWELDTRSAGVAYPLSYQINAHSAQLLNGVYYAGENPGGLIQGALNTHHTPYVGAKVSGLTVFHKGPYSAANLHTAEFGDQYNQVKEFIMEDVQFIRTDDPGHYLEYISGVTTPGTFLISRLSPLRDTNAPVEVLFDGVVGADLEDHWFKVTRANTARTILFWFDVDDGGSAPGEAADEVIEVDVSAADDAEDIVDAIVAAASDELTVTDRGDKVWLAHPELYGSNTNTTTVTTSTTPPFTAQNKYRPELDDTFRQTFRRINHAPTLEVLRVDVTDLTDLPRCNLLIRIEDCTFRNLMRTLITSAVSGNALVSTLSEPDFVDRLRVEFVNTSFFWGYDYEGLSGAYGASFSPNMTELWERIAKFQNCKFLVPSTMGVSDAYELDDELYSEQNGVFEYDAAGAETYIDIETKLFWTPTVVNAVRLDNNGSALVKRVEIIEPGGDFKGMPTLRVHMTAALGDEDVEIQWSAAVNPIKA
jgi:hypothetical protein